MAANRAGDKLVADDGSWVQRRVITDPAVYELELERIFSRRWLAVAHESQVSEPGSFVTSWMGEDSVIVSRDREGDVHVVLNSCSHRASRVCRVDQGNTKIFTCPNHGWTYAPDGQLLGVPRASLGYSERPTEGLLPARVEIAYGLVFATFESDAPPLKQHLGDTAFYLESVFDRYEHGTEILAGAMRSRVACNWKLALENLGTDLQHPEVAHGSFMDLWPDPVMQFLEDSEQIITSSGNPMCIGRQPPPYTEPDLVLQGIEDAAERREVQEWFDKTNKYAENHLGVERANLYVFTGSVFPNLSFLPGVSAVFLVHPKGPQEMEWWSWCLVASDAPRAVRAMRRRIFTLTCGPGGVILAEDAENWADMTRACAGVIGRRLPLRIDRGVGEEYEDPSLPGVFAHMRSEHAQRGFWKSWQRAMAE